MRGKSTKTNKGWHPLIFLGVPQAALARDVHTPGLYQLFGSYLDYVDQQGVTYVGKRIAGALSLEQLDELDAHVRSLLKRLAPHTLPPPCSLFALDAVSGDPLYVNS